VIPGPSAGPAAIFFLATAVVVCALSALGLLVMKGFYNKLHYLAPTAILGTFAIAAAVLAQEGPNANAIKAALVLLAMFVGNPVITFAAARAHHLRETQIARDGDPRKPEREPALTTSPGEEGAPPRPDEE
jgi:monovalent cation/proton antiporter MnhG/PhaG subunit